MFEKINQKLLLRLGQLQLLAAPDLVVLGGNQLVHIPANGSQLSGNLTQGIGQMRIGGYAQNALRVLTDDVRPILGPLDWLRLGTLDGARALGLDEVIGSVEPGKEADLMCIDPSLTDPVPPGPGDAAEAPASDVVPEELASRIIFRAHPEMVRGAWVRGRLLPA